MEKGFLAVTYRNCSLVKFPIPGGIAPLIEVWSNITLVRFVNWNRIGGKGPVKGFVDIVLHKTNQLIHANK
jgi:hypothetical protein